MSDIEQLRAGDTVLEAQEITLRDKRDKLLEDEAKATTTLRAAALELRKVRQARAEIQRRIREEEDPRPEVSPEVETIIHAVTATAQSANGPPETEV